MCILWKLSFYLLALFPWSHLRGLSEKKNYPLVEPFDKRPPLSGDKPESFGTSLKIVIRNIVTFFSCQKYNHLNLYLVKEVKYLSAFQHCYPQWSLQLHLILESFYMKSTFQAQTSQNGSMQLSHSKHSTKWGQEIQTCSHLDLHPQTHHTNSLMNREFRQSPSTHSQPFPCSLLTPDW